MQRIIHTCFRLWLVFAPFAVLSQNCLERLDSAVSFSKYDKQEALLYAEQLITDLDSARCPAELGYAEAYNNLGLIYLGFSQYEKAIGAIKKSLQLKLEKYDSLSTELIDICLNLSSAYQYARLYSEAEIYLQWAISAVKSNYTESDRRYLEALYRSALFNRDVGNYDKSRWDFETTLSIVERHFSLNDSIRGSLLTEYGTLLRLTGEYAETEQVLERAINLLRGKYELLHLRAVDRLAALKLDNGEFSESENHLLSNLQLKKEDYPEDSLIMIETLNNLAILYFKINDLESAEKYYNELYRYARGQPQIQPYVANNMGAIYLKKGDYKRAETYFQSSVDDLRQLYGGIHPDYANALSNLANTHKGLMDLNGALNLYMRVLDLDNVIYGPDNQRYATTLNNIALVYQLMGYYDLTEKLLTQSLAIRKARLGEKHPLYAKNLNDLGVYYLSKKDTLQALIHFDKALEAEIHHMQTVFPVLTDTQRQLFFEDTRFNLERFASLCFSERFFNSTWVEKAFDYYLNTKSVLFYAADKMRQVMLQSEDAAIKNTFIKWRDMKYLLAESYLLSSADLESRGIDIGLLEEECNALEKKLALLSSAFSSQNELSFYTWRDLAQNLEDQSVLVEMIEFRNYLVKEGDFGAVQGFEDRSRYVAFVLEAKGQELKRMRFSSSAELEDQFNFYRNSLKFGMSDAHSYEVFWKEIDGLLLGKKKVYYAPDGIFHKLNPAVFYDAAAGQYVADKYKLVYITSGKDFMQGRNAGNSSQPTAAIFGNPDFSKLNLPAPLNPLPEAEREADEITAILEKNKWQVTDYYFLDATEGNLKAREDPGILHLATHGYFDDDSNSKNSLLHSGVYLSKEKGTPEDGILTAYEAMNLKLDQTRLVVLSACETGLGTIKNGEGVFGLQRAFLVAGAGNLIISLVKVNDSATKNFMNMFYSELMKTQSIEESFFSARASFKDQYTDPYTWGAFILVSKH